MKYYKLRTAEEITNSSYITEFKMGDFLKYTDEMNEIAKKGTIFTKQDAGSRSKYDYLISILISPGIDTQVDWLVEKDWIIEVDYKESAIDISKYEGMMYLVNEKNSRYIIQYISEDFDIFVSCFNEDKSIFINELCPI